MAEASATGLPIIAFDAGDSKRILEKYDYGFIVNNNQQFAEKTLWLLQNPITKGARSKSAQSQLRQLDFSITVNEYKEFIAL